MKRSLVIGAIDNVGRQVLSQLQARGVTAIWILGFDVNVGWALAAATPGQARYPHAVNGICNLHTRALGRLVIYAEHSTVLFRMHVP
jgi:hypothetical protein